MARKFMVIVVKLILILIALRCGRALLPIHLPPLIWITLTARCIIALKPSLKFVTKGKKNYGVLKLLVAFILALSTASVKLPWMTHYILV